MDRNSAIGLTLIAVLLLVYFNFFSPSPAPTPKKPVEVSTTDLGKPDSVSAKPETAHKDSVLAKQYGSLSSFLKGEEILTKVETKDLIVTLSNQATVEQVELRNFKTYSQKPLLLASPNTNSFSLQTTLDGQPIDLYRLFYKAESTKVKDTTVVTFTADIGTGVFIKHIYSIPAEGFKIGYRIEAHGLEDKLSGKTLDFSWTDHIALQEKDITWPEMILTGSANLP
jgi:YidC/Oxa1 family membrane protein insertase